MLRQARNELSLVVRIEGLSPLLVKDGRKGGGSPELPAMLFQSRHSVPEINTAVNQNRLATDAFRDRLFVAGSSIRGAWRAHLEKTLRSLDDAPKVCDPFIGVGSEDQDERRKAAEAGRVDRACSGRLANQDGSPPPYPYHGSCPVCQLFGNTAQGSRISFGEGRFVGGTATVVANNAISRQTGAAISPFKSLVVLDAAIEAEVQVRNFELWQAGLLGHLFDDLGSGLVRLGSGKSKGWGRVRAEAISMRLTYFGLRDWVAAGRLAGVAEMMEEGEARKYGMTKNAESPLLPAHTQEPGPALWRRTVTILGPNEFWGVCKSYFNAEFWASIPELPARPAAGGRRA